MMSNGTAILSDVVMKFGGAEKVVEAMLQMYPESDLYTLFIVPSARKNIEKKYPKVKIRTSAWQLFIRNDRVSKYISIIKILSWIYWERLDLSGYKLVISSSHSFMSKNAKAEKVAFHLAYIHTPPRYLYDEFNELGFIKQWPMSVLFWPVKQFLRYIDKRGIDRPNLLIANSKNVQRRIKKYYDRESTLVYPPVDEEILKKYANQKTGDYYVWVSRLVRQKGIWLAAETCEKLGRKLMVIGGGDELKNLLTKKFERVVFEGPCDDEKKCQIISSAKALIYTSEDEDFGIVPVEALKMGVPVIGHNSGGVKEVVTDGVNGLLYESGEMGLAKAILKFEKLKFSKERCHRSVDGFGKEIFKQNIKLIIKKYVGKN